jgi:hypothetical protein
MVDLVLRRANVSRKGGPWSETDHDVFDGDRDVGRIFQQADGQWFWGVSFQLTRRKSYGHTTSLDAATGLSIFEELHSRRHDGRVILLMPSTCARLDGEDLRPQPLHERKARLEALLADASAGIQYNEHVDGGGQVVFEHACRLGLEGIVSKHREHPYRSGRSKTWLNVKNPPRRA